MSGCGGKKKTEGKGLGSGSPLPFFCGRGGRRRGERGNLSILRFLLLFPSFCLFLSSSCPDVAIFISISEKVGGGDRAWEGKNYGKGEDQCLPRIRHGNSSSRDTKGPTLYLATPFSLLPYSFHMSESSEMISPPSFCSPLGCTHINLRTMP